MSAESSADPGPRRLMVVEDDEDIRSLLAFSLGQVGGYNVQCCEGGASALAVVDDFRPDLVLLDVMMPGMSGPELLVHLRRRPVMAGVPVVFLTAKAMPSELEDLLAHAATGIIVKPFDPISLPQDVAMYLELSRGRAG